VPQAARSTNPHSRRKSLAFAFRFLKENRWNSSVVERMLRVSRGLLLCSERGWHIAKQAARAPHMPYTLCYRGTSLIRKRTSLGPYVGLCLGP
jgi:hypothetical protein